MTALICDCIPFAVKALPIRFYDGCFASWARLPAQILHGHRCALKPAAQALEDKTTAHADSGQRLGGVPLPSGVSASAAMLWAPQAWATTPPPPPADEPQPEEQQEEQLQPGSDEAGHTAGPDDEQLFDSVAGA